VTKARPRTTNTLRGCTLNHPSFDTTPTSPRKRRTTLRLRSRPSDQTSQSFQTPARRWWHRTCILFPPLERTRVAYPLLPSPESRSSGSRSHAQLLQSPPQGQRQNRSRSQKSSPSYRHTLHRFHSQSLHHQQIVPPLPLLPLLLLPLFLPYGCLRSRWLMGHLSEPVPPFFSPMAPLPPPPSLQLGFSRLLKPPPNDDLCSDLKEPKRRPLRSPHYPHYHPLNPQKSGSLKRLWIGSRLKGSIRLLVTSSLVRVSY